MRLRLLPAAIADLKQAARWYESERKGFGKSFKADVTEVFDKIISSPSSYQKISGEMRRAVVYRFHYAVVYRAQANEIVIIRVVHCASQTHQDIILR